MTENYTKKFVTYGSDRFVSFPIISTKLLSQSFFFSKLNLSTASMIYENEMKTSRNANKNKRSTVVKRRGKTYWKIKHNEPDTSQMENGLWLFDWMVLGHVIAIEPTTTRRKCARFQAQMKLVLWITTKRSTHLPICFHFDGPQTIKWR